jgi:O-acetyl-ADP-ribose deacetylase (regulator of RNase III)
MRNTLSSADRVQYFQLYDAKRHRAAMRGGRQRSEGRAMQIVIQGRTLALAEGDITLQRVDAIVNAANSRLAGGGGVDGAIHRRGGAAIKDETDRRYPQGCPTGSAVITAAGHLDARWVIHAVGPVWNGGQSGEAQLLASAYRRALVLAAEHQCQSVALPALSCGAYGYPVDLASRVALATVRDFLTQDPQITLARFVLFGPGMYGAFAAALEEMVQ